MERYPDSMPTNFQTDQTDISILKTIPNWVHIPKSNSINFTTLPYKAVCLNNVQKSSSDSNWN